MKKNYTVFFTLLVALCTILVLANITVAQGGSEKGNKKCTDGIDNDGDGLIDGDDPDCGEDPGGDPVFMGDLDVRWSTAQTTPSFFEVNNRFCFLGSASNDYGNYHCRHLGGALGIGEDVSYDLPGSGPGVEQIARKGDASLCGSFVGGRTLNPNSAYDFDWDCTASNGICRIRVLNWYHPDLPQGGSQPIPGVGAVIIEGFADTAGGHTNANPFADAPMTLSIDEVVIDFKAENRNKTIAKCRYTGSAIDGITFDVVHAP